MDKLIIAITFLAIIGVSCSNNFTKSNNEVITINFNDFDSLAQNLQNKRISISGVVSHFGESSHHLFLSDEISKQIIVVQTSDKLQEFDRI